MEIRCGMWFGPTFSGGGGDLSAFSEPFNGDGKCCSYANEPGYRIPLDGTGTNMLTNNKGDRFTTTELEVWEVIYLE
jgi:hypothetical protein